MSLNYHDKYVLEYGETSDSDIFVNTQLQLDFAASYKISHNFKVFVEMVNITNEPYRTYLSSDARPLQIEYYKPWGIAGLRFNL